MKKHVFVAVFIVGLLLFGMSSTFAITEKTVIEGFPRTLVVSDVIKDFSREELLKMDMQEKVTRAYNEIINSFEQTDTNIIFPDEYGGAYNNGNGRLVVKLTDLSRSIVSRYAKAVSNPGILIFNKAEYSKNDLESLCKEVIRWFQAEEIDWNQCYACDETIKAVIIVPGTGYTKAQAFIQSKIALQKGTQLPVTVQASEKEKPTAALQGGSSLRKSGSSVSTLAFCGTYDGSPAIITCGHGGLSEGTKVYVNSSVTSNMIGTITVQQYKYNESGDFSITKITGNQRLTNLVQYSSGTAYAVKGYFNLPAKNDIVYNFGKNGHRNKCQVINTNTILNHGSEKGPFYVLGMVHTTILESEASGVLNGDSGSPVYSLSSNEATALGVLSSGGSSTMTFSPLKWVRGFAVKTS